MRTQSITQFLIYLSCMVCSFPLAAQWAGSTTAAGLIFRSGDVLLEGGKLFLGTTQSLEAGNNTSLRWNSNNSSTSQIILRDHENKNYGRIIGNANGLNFGLYDADNNWSLLNRKDSYIQFRVNNLNRLQVNDNYTRITTASGRIDVGAKNISYAHFTTDRPAYYFNKEIRVNSGNIGSYDENLSLRTQGSTKMTVKKSNGNVGIGTTAPSQKLQVEGDIRAHNIYASSPSNLNIFAQYGNSYGRFEFSLYNGDDTGLRLLKNINGQRAWWLINRGGANGKFSILTHNQGQSNWKNVLSAYSDGNVAISKRLLQVGEGQTDIWETGVTEDNEFVFCKKDETSCLEFGMIGPTGSTQWGIDGNFGDSKHHFFGELCANFKEGDCGVWPDYVFENEYEIMPLEEVEAYVQKNKHLPYISSAADIEENGMVIQSTMSGLTRQIEELTLHAIQQEKQLVSKKERVQKLRNDLQELNQLMDEYVANN